MANRRGRPRKDPFRQGAGKSCDNPYGPTTAQEARRRALVGKDGPPEWAEYPLGVLRAQGYLSEEQHDAGCRYAWLFRVAIGGGGVSAVNLTGRTFDGPESRSEVWLAGRAADHQAARDLLQSHGRRTRSLVEDVTVYQRLPGFCLQRRFLTRAENLALARLQAGLSALSALFSEAVRRAA